MEMDKVILIRTLSYSLQHGHMQRVRIPDRAVDAKRSRPYRLKSRGRDRVATGVQCDVVSEGDQLFGEPMNHTLCTAIKLRRYGLRQRRNLGNVHVHDLRLVCHVPGSATIRFRAD